MQNWKEPETSVIHLANGEEVAAVVNGISPEDGSGYVLVQSRQIKVMPLSGPWTWKWAEVLTVKRNDGSTFETVLDPLQLSEKSVVVDQGDEQVSILLDGVAWREMTEQEYEQEQRAWSEDLKDMQKIKDEWREYREG